MSAPTIRERAADVLRAIIDVQADDSLNSGQAYKGMVDAIEAALAAVQAEGPKELQAIGERIRTQDNRITDAPLFIVQQKRKITGIDTDWDPQIMWLWDGEECDPEEAAKLEAEYDETGEEPENTTRTGYIEIWEFVTACFTEQGCKDYIAINGHNLKEPRIYAESSYRNYEYRAVRDWLKALPTPPQEGE